MAVAVLGRMTNNLQGSVSGIFNGSEMADDDDVGGEVRAHRAAQILYVQI